MNFAMATLGLKEMGKFLWEGRKKSMPSWLSQFSFAKLRDPNLYKKFYQDVIDKKGYWKKSIKMCLF